MTLLSLHPELAPFIGKLYPKAPLKVFFLGESHYLPAAYNYKAYLNTATIARFHTIKNYYLIIQIYFVPLSL